MCRGNFVVECYQWLYFDLSPVQQGKQAAEFIDAGGLKPFVWFDLEERTTQSPDAIVAFVNRAIEAAKIESGIYSGKWFWDEHLPGVTAFNHLPLFDALYDDVANFDYWQNHKYGGWEHVAMKQYSDSGEFNGLAVDLDTYLE